MLVVSVAQKFLCKYNLKKTSVLTYNTDIYDIYNTDICDVYFLKYAINLTNLRRTRVIMTNTIYKMLLRLFKLDIKLPGVQLRRIPEKIILDCVK